MFTRFAKILNFSTDLVNITRLCKITLETWYGLVRSCMMVWSPKIVWFLLNGWPSVISQDYTWLCGHTWSWVVLLCDPIQHYLAWCYYHSRSCKFFTINCLVWLYMIIHCTCLSKGHKWFSSYTILCDLFCILTLHLCKPTEWFLKP